ncbi:hypothetical protein PLCT1_01210 [Planctomycetaceae bacterium]|nr:hypothetical protein PLCT1_01210 [Planctomycetaceae bacterium]
MHPPDALLTSPFPAGLWSAMQAVPDLLFEPRAGLTAPAVAAFQAYWPYELPADVVSWSRLVSYVPIGSQLLSFAETDNAGYSPYIAFAQSRWLEQGWLVVGGDGSGDFYVVLTAPGPTRGLVCFIDQDNTDRLAYAVASHFVPFLRLLAARESGTLAHHWPFDARSYATADPHFTRLVPKELLPWR